MRTTVHPVDIAAGHIFRILHAFRGAKENTVADLEVYMRGDPDELAPEPPPLRNVTEHESIFSHALRTTTLSWTSTHEVLCPRYRERHEREYETNQTAWARWIRPDRRTRATCMIYVHGWLEPGPWIDELLLFPRWTRELDVDILHVSLPFHGKRNPKHALFSGEYYFTGDVVRSIESVRQTVHDARSIMGWLRGQGYERVGVVGASLGGSIAMALASVDPAPDFIVSIVSHLHFAEAVERAKIFWRVKHDLTRFGVDADERHRIFDSLRQKNYLPVLAPEKQLWVNARNDGHIDPALVNEQWVAWGRPNILWYDGGHLMFPFHMTEITRAMRGLLRDL